MSKRSPEDALVARIARSFSANRHAGLRLGAGDDAALWQPRRGFETVLTSDWFLEGSHFLRDMHPADSVGWKCLARAASDVGAMGGIPRCFLLNLAIPSSHTGDGWIGFWEDFGGRRRFLDCAMAGGDTTRSERILINVTVVGEVEARRAVLRSGARPDDLLFVSGRLGEAELGLQELRKIKGLVKASDCHFAKAFVSQAADCFGAVAGGEPVGQRDDGYFGWAFDGFGEVVRGQRGWGGDCGRCIARAERSRRTPRRIGWHCTAGMIMSCCLRCGRGG